MPDRVASVAVFTQETPGEIYITLGAGDHSCERWKISASLLEKLIREAVNIRFSCSLQPTTSDPA